MELREIPEDEAHLLIEAPETGMGYQIGALVEPNGSKIAGFFVAGRYFVPKESPDLHGNPAASDASKLLLLEPPEPANRSSGHSFGLSIELQLPADTNPTPLSAQPETPPHPGTTTESDLFYRFSAFRDDRRVRPNGSLAPQTYCTSDTDRSVVPSGLAAVGRYALPTRLSARHVFEVRPGAGFPILFGTVTPNFGLAGGGVEVYFPEGTGADTVTRGEPLPVK